MISKDNNLPDDKQGIFDPGLDEPEVIMTEDDEPFDDYPDDE